MKSSCYTVCCGTDLSYNLFMNPIVMCYHQRESGSQGFTVHVSRVEIWSRAVKQIRVCSGMAPGNLMYVQQL